MHVAWQSRAERRQQHQQRKKKMEEENARTTTDKKLTTTQIEQLRVQHKVFEIFNLLNHVPPNARSVIALSATQTHHNRFLRQSPNEKISVRRCSYCSAAADWVGGDSGTNCRIFHRDCLLSLEVRREKHIEFFFKGLRLLGPSYYVLDANRPWICYWILHSIALLGESVDIELENDIVDFLSRCQDKNGGYGGGPGQNQNAFVLDADERTIRGIQVASMLNILDAELVKNVGDYVSSCLEKILLDAGSVSVYVVQLVDSEYNCQTYEGGIAGEPGSEAHGGYFYSLDSMQNWVAFRQGVECGFQGRTNKLVDGCYSFWQGGALALLQRLSSLVDKQLKLPSAEEMKVQNESTCNVAATNLSEVESDSDAHEADKPFQSVDEGNLPDIGFSFIEKQAEWGPLFKSIALQQYILLCSQCVIIAAQRRLVLFLYQE
ncbi:hypothetical protein ACLOJK_030910 [Asimina triloba]